MTRSDDAVIVVERLTKRYGELLAVDDVSFAVKKGELFAFLGPNGAGKTTTVEIIETIRTPTSGRVSVFGMDVTQRKHEILPRIGVLPQGFSSFDRITVGESIRYYAALFGRKVPDSAGLLELTGLQEQRDVQFRTLSGGLKQRLGIAIALVNDPEVLFLDEPTTGLDPHGRRAVWDVLLGLKRRGKVVFLTTHYMEEAELLADTVAIIARGKMVAVGAPGELIERHAESMCLTLRSVDARMRATITTMGFQSEQDEGDTLKVRVTSTDDVQAILAGLKVAGRTLPGMDVRRPNLEEVFLSLTGEALRTDAPADGGSR